jgi:DNA-directed RNA polymerase subunit RPC12/RpoP
MKNKKLLRTKTIECPACRSRTPGSQVFAVKQKVYDRFEQPVYRDGKHLIKEVPVEVDLPRFTFFRLQYRLCTYKLLKGIQCVKCGHLISEGKAEY